MLLMRHFLRHMMMMMMMTPNQIHLIFINRIFQIALKVAKLKNGDYNSEYTFDFAIKSKA